MSLADLKRHAADLPENERRELAAYLLQVGRERDPAWQGEISRRMEAMDTGKRITQADFERRVGFAEN